MTESRLTPNQVVAYNLKRARMLNDWTQAQAAEHLEPFLGEHWSKATFSVAESSMRHPERIRQFTADDILAFAAGFDLPVSYFFQPPQEFRAGATAYVADAIGAPKAKKALSPESLIALANGSANDAAAARAQQRLQDLMDANPDLAEQMRVREEEVRQEALQIAEGQKRAGLAALREGAVIRGVQPKGKKESKS